MLWRLVNHTALIAVGHAILRLIAAQSRPIIRAQTREGQFLWVDNRGGAHKFILLNIWRVIAKILRFSGLENINYQSFARL